MLRAPRTRTRRGRCRLCLLVLVLVLGGCFAVPALAAPAVRPSAGAMLRADVAPGATAWVETPDGVGINLRAGPGFDTPVIGAVDEGDPVEILDGPISADDGSEWYEVATGDDTGYADGEFLVAAPSGESEEPGFTAADVGRVPILMYHHLDDSGNEYSVTPEQLDAQCAWLVDHGYTAITLSRLVAAVFDGALLPAQPVVITDDDGWATSLQFAGILARYGLVGTFFVNNSSELTPDQVATLAQEGDVEAHTVDHPVLSNLGYDDQYAEITNNRAYLEDTTGQSVGLLAWPYGDSNASAVQAAADAGIVAAVDAGGGVADLTALDRWHIPRVEIASWDTLDSFAGKVES